MSNYSTRGSEMQVWGPRRTIKTACNLRSLAGYSFRIYIRSRILKAKRSKGNQSPNISVLQLKKKERKKQDTFMKNKNKTKKQDIYLFHFLLQRYKDQC